MKFTNTGMAICEFSLALNRRVKSGDNWIEDPQFFDITLFGKQGESVSPYLRKGIQVAITGELRQDRWEQDGQKRSKVKIVANSLQLLGSKPSGGGGQERFTRNADTSGDAPADEGGFSDQGNPGTFEDDIPF
jgi:single-strand DNA-binding protein